MSYHTNIIKDTQENENFTESKKIHQIINFKLISQAQSFRQTLKQKNQKPGITFSKIAFAVFSIISFFYLTFIFSGKQSLVVSATNQMVREQTQDAVLSKAALPVRLIIPSINVDASVEEAGLTLGGAMEAPDNILDVGWYKLGVFPGEVGSAVISGHFDGNNGESGVLNNLDKLKSGDKIYVINNQGTTVTFMVRESRTYNPGYADEVFLPNDNGTHLNLITCDGTWDGAKKSYSKRLVVFSDILEKRR